jgi:hypothetical protein
LNGASNIGGGLLDFRGDGLQGKVTRDTLFQDGISAEHHQSDAILGPLLRRHSLHKVERLLPHGGGDTLRQVEQKHDAGPLIRLRQAQPHQSTHQ